MRLWPPMAWKFLAGPDTLPNIMLPKLPIRYWCLRANSGSRVNGWQKHRCRCLCKIGCICANDQCESRCAQDFCWKQRIGSGSEGDASRPIEQPPETSWRSQVSMAAQRELLEGSDCQSSKTYHHSRLCPERGGCYVIGNLYNKKANV